MKSIEKEINGRKYQLLSFGSLKSLRLASKIANTLKGSSLNQSSGVEDLIFHLVGNDEFADLVLQLCEGVTCNGVTIDFDNHFAEHKSDLLPCLGMSLKENVLPFFDPAALETLMDLMTENL